MEIYSVSWPHRKPPPYGRRSVRLPSIDGKAIRRGVAWHRTIRNTSIVEYFIDRLESDTLGDLRNMAFDLMPSGSVWVQWDDDDYSAPDRIAAQWGHMRSVRAHASVLRRQLVIRTADADDNSGGRSHQHVIHRCHPQGRYASWLGHEGTLMARAIDAAAYPSKRTGEDTDFLLSLQQDLGISISVYENEDPTLFTKFVHGRGGAFAPAHHDDVYFTGKDVHKYSEHGGADINEKVSKLVADRERALTAGKR